MRGADRSGRVGRLPRERAAAARSELTKLIQLRADALASRTPSVRDERYVLAVIAKQKHRVRRTRPSTHNTRRRLQRCT